MPAADRPGTARSAEARSAGQFSSLSLSFPNQPPASKTGCASDLEKCLHSKEHHLGCTCVDSSTATEASPSSFIAPGRCCQEWIRLIFRACMAKPDGSRLPP